MAFASLTAPVDDTEDENIWRPHFWRGLTPAEMAVYPEHKSWVTLNFRHFIQVSEPELRQL
jgi:hypothetical protein